MSISRSLLALALSVVNAAAVAANVDLANAPLSNGSGGSTIIRPNIAFVFDDSGSMAFENMPDDDGVNIDKRCWGWHGYNTLAYNPAYTYKPPYKVDGAIYSDGVPRFADASFTAAMSDGYFSLNETNFVGDSNDTVDLSTRSNLSPNPVDCNTKTGAVGVGARATITVSGSGKATSVSSIKVGTVELLSGLTSGSNSPATVAVNIASGINARNNITGYSATVSNNVVTIKASYSLGNLSATPVVTASDGLTLSPTAFTGYAAGSGAECSSSSSKYYYAFHKTNPASTTCEADTDSTSNYYIVTDSNRIEAPGIPDTNRTTAQIAAAKTNYANWYSYYRRRGYLLKAAAGEAFAALDQSKYRVGLFFMNSKESGSTAKNPPNSDLKIDDFSGAVTQTQRYNWYSSLYGARGSSGTPTRGAVARMGRMYAGKIDGWDPVQYSCQQNFTIVSTDGFWNNSNESSSYGPLKLDGQTRVGNQDFGPIEAVPATATLTIDANGSNACYRFTSLQVVTGAGNIELLNASPIPASCTSTVSTLGTAVQNAINAKTATTGFRAAWADGKLTITSPVALGGITTTPLFSVTKVSGKKDMTFKANAFNGFVNAIAGAPLPYKDVLGASNSLADVAWYYWNTDLRTEDLRNCSNKIGTTTYNDLCTNNVLGSGEDKNQQQHMTLFTLGLGVSGRIKYSPNYKTEADIPGVTQYVDIVNGTANWPLPDNGTTIIDDLWHAAVNGRGTYFSASNPQTVQEGIQSALAGIQARTGSAAAAATSNLQPVAGDNFVYVAQYRPLSWDGELSAFPIDPVTGAVSSLALWSARTQLDAKVGNASSGDGRSIKYFSASATNKLKDFTLANLAADGLAGHFSNICNKVPAIDQCGSDVNDLSTAKKARANDGANLVAWLRGSAALDMAASDPANQIFRAREHVLGDIVNAMPVHVKAPPFRYGIYDASYSVFKTNNAQRAATVYAAANDGMLHAFSATDGGERWAYVPSLLMPNLYKLADRNYAANHQYFTDGSPTVADVCTTLSASNAQVCNADNAWKTILVAGLNKGGCGYYALDVTDPANPRGLWEFTHPNLGYSYGNPIVARRKNGQWVVMLSSGYNNVPGNGCGNTGDGNGHLFVLDAATGALLDDIPTKLASGNPAGSTATPSGLAKLNAWIQDDALARADRVYGGDLLGNVWRFDFDDNTAPAGKEAVLLATLRDAAGGGGNRQPITTRLELAEISNGSVGIPVVLAGTGKYLGVSDIANQSQQSIYALKDSLQATGISDVRGVTMLQRTLTQSVGADNTVLAGRTIRTVGGQPLAWSQANRDGWYLDLNPGNASPGERVNVDMSLQFNTLTVATNKPDGNACNIGGTAYLYFLDLRTGLALNTALQGMAGVQLAGNALVVGVSNLLLGSGKEIALITDSEGKVETEDTSGGSGSGAGLARRSAWREIAD